MKKVLSLVMVLMMALSMVGFASAESDFSEHISVEISMWEISGFGDDALGQYIEEKFNVDIVNILQEWSDYRDKFVLQASADELPDSFAGYPLSEAWFAKLVDDDMLRTIPMEMIEKYPNVLATCQASSEWNLAMKMYDGEVYYIPRMLSASGAVTGLRTSIMYRKDWAEKLGITEVPTDMDALYDMLYAFANNDPDGNGEKDTYGLVGGLTILYNGFDAYPNLWVKNAEGVSIPGYLDKEAMVEALTWLRKAWENGAIDPELTAERTKWTSGAFGAHTNNIDSYWLNRYLIEEWEGGHPELGSAVEYIEIADAFSAHAGGTATKAPELDSSGTVFAYDTTDEELDRLLAIYDYLLSDEGNMLRYWGFEGEDYEIGDDGKPVKLHDEALRTKYPSIFIQNWPSWDHDFLMDVENGDPTISVEVKEKAIASRANSNAAYNPETSKVDVLANYTTTEEKNDFMFDYEAELTTIITGAEDVETMYDAMVEKAYTNGVQDVIDSVNAAIGELG